MKSQWSKKCKRQSGHATKPGSMQVGAVTHAWAATPRDPLRTPVNYSSAFITRCAAHGKLFRGGGHAQWHAGAVPQTAWPCQGTHLGQGHILLSFQVELRGIRIASAHTFHCPTGCLNVYHVARGNLHRHSMYINTQCISILNVNQYSMYITSPGETCTDSRAALWTRCWPRPSHLLCCPGCACAHACACVCMSVFVCVCLCARVRTRVCALRVSVCVCVLACVSACVCVCV